MSKKSSHLLAFAAFFAIFIVAVGLLFYASTQKLVPSLGFLGQGWNTLSISTMNIISNDPELNGKQTWLVTVVANGMGQYLVGENTLKDPSTGAASTTPLKVELNINKETCNYDILNQGTKVYTLVKNEWCQDAPGFSGCTTSCYAMPNMFAYVWFGGAFSALPGNKNAYCITKSEVASVGSISYRSLTFDGTMSVSSGGQNYTGSINSFDQKSVALGDKVKAFWSGNLVSGESCPSASDQLVSAMYVGGVWRTVDKNTYDYYAQRATLSELNGCIQLATGDQKGKADQCVQAWATRATNTISDYKNIVSTGGSAATASGTLSAGQAKLELNKLIQFPVITMHVDSNWIKIFIPVGKPVITSVLVKDFQTGQQGIVEVGIRNDGTALGSFSASVSCGTAITQTGISPEINLQAGETGKVYIPITGSCAAAKTETCTVKVYDRNNPANKVERSLSATCQPIVQCSPDGSEDCLGLTKRLCVSGLWQNKETCANGCVLQAGKAVCSNIPPPPQPGQGCNNVCDAGDSDTKIPLLDWSIPFMQGRCPSDCQGINIDYLGLFLFLLVVAATLYIGSRGQKGKKLDAVPYVYGLVLALIAALVIKFIVDSLIWIIGGVLVLVVLGILILLFGGAWILPILTGAASIGGAAAAGYAERRSRR